MSSAPPRVVSLVPSVTETLLAWGVDVAACTRFCEQPGLTHVGGTKDPDLAAIVALRPDLVVMDREENRAPDAAALVAAGLTVHATQVTSVASAEQALRDLAAVLGLPAPAWSLPLPAEAWATAAVLIWRRPWMALGADTYGADLLAHLGVADVVTADDGRYPEVTLEALADRSPDVVLLPSEPYPFKERHAGEVAAAMPGAEVLLLDGRDLLWWGVRTPGALARLEALMAVRRGARRRG